ncbi:MAG TPA: 2-oxo acid dehydrogenase subunit E2 [Thermoleophilia bacterium]|nr:2-oxo acid dehydrogenase subunit E2 [Thermoleophilia bacterium]
MSEDLLGRYRVLPYPLERTAGLDLFRMASRKHYVPVLLETDVSAARAAIARHKSEGEDLSFTAWVVACVAQAAAEHKRVHAVRKGRKLVVFDDVDAALAVYRRLADDESDERLPMPFVLRRANAKSVAEISDEVRRAQRQRLEPRQQWLEARGFAPPPWLLPLAFRTPVALRRWLYWDRLLGSPRRIKETMGTVMVTSVPLTSRSGGGGWGIPIAVHPLVVAIGAVGRRPGLVDDHVEPRDFVSLTVLFDHEVVDGVPVALFLKRLTQLMETAFGL